MRVSTLVLFIYMETDFKRILFYDKLHLKQICYLENCGKCMHWFRGLVHRCSTSVQQEELKSQSSVQSIGWTTAQTVKCYVCGRGFNRLGDLKRQV